MQMIILLYSKQIDASLLFLIIWLPPLVITSKYHREFSPLHYANNLSDRRERWRVTKLRMPSQSNPGLYGIACNLPFDARAYDVLCVCARVGFRVNRNLLFHIHTCRVGRRESGQGGRNRRSVQWRVMIQHREDEAFLWIIFCDLKILFNEGHI